MPVMDKVTAGVIQKDGKILIARRKTGKCIGAKWEFPGGKLELGETLEECLKREIREELNIEIKVGDFITSVIFFCNDRKLELLAYRADYVSGDIELIDHDEIRWVLPSELAGYEFTLPDVPIVELLNYQL